MISQPRAVTPFRPSLSSHLHAKGATCPWCEQEIPTEKLKEISGKIALREREQSLAISARLEQKFAAERIEAEAIAKAELELERRESAAREAAAREEARKIAETAAMEKIAAAETNRQQLESALQAKTEQERTAREAEFPDDNIQRIPKGSPGADVRHIVMMNGNECGTILYDSKNHNQFRTDHVNKLKADQIADKAEHAILSTYKFPQGTRHVHVQDGVVLVSPARVVAIATIIRGHMTQIYTLRVSRVERESKMSELFEFIVSERCTQLLGRIEKQAEDLLELQAREIKWHKNNWEKQGEAYKAIQKAKGDLETDIGCIIGTAAALDPLLAEGQS
jgi:hypothetical protein